jgi:hypothetical protein
MKSDIDASSGSLMHQRDVYQVIGGSVSRVVFYFLLRSGTRTGCGENSANRDHRPAASACSQLITSAGVSFVARIISYVWHNTHQYRANFSMGNAENADSIVLSCVLQQKLH